jgi:hypothetical protein
MSMLRLQSEELWHRAVAALRRRGQWLSAAELMTPAEAADLLRSRFADPRLAAFVEGFYYPQRYGDQTGSMSLEDATRLIIDLEGKAALQIQGRQADPSAQSPVESAPPTPVLCGICRRNTRRESDRR